MIKQILLKWIKLPKYLICYIDNLADFWHENRNSNIKISWKELRPYLFDKNKPSKVAKHYFLQDCWAINKITSPYGNKIYHHYDVGSRIDGFVGQLAASFNFITVYYININKPSHSPWGCYVKGSATNLPMESNSVMSLSSLHVIEHIGLGRYGDELDPDGWKKAIAEFKRVLAPGGNLYLSVPIGRERIVFNAHRIFNPFTIINKCKPLKLIDNSYIDEHNRYYIDSFVNFGIKPIPNKAFQNNSHSMKYGCGLFHFRKDE